MNEITRKQLIELYHNDVCGTWRSSIKEILSTQPLASDDDIFTIEDKYIKMLIDEGSDNQKKLAKSAGIKITIPHTSWSRNMGCVRGDYYYVGRDADEGFRSYGANNLTIPKLHTYETRELADKEAKLFSLMQIMRSWARHHNKIDRFVADWNDDSDKWGITLDWNGCEVCTRCWTKVNAFVFQIAVSSKKRAEEMLKEFENDIQAVDFNC